MLFVHYNEKLKIISMKIIDRGITIAYKNICPTLYTVAVNKPQHS